MLTGKGAMPTGAGAPCVRAGPGAVGLDGETLGRLGTLGHGQVGAQEMLCPFTSLSWAVPEGCNWGDEPHAGAGRAPPRPLTAASPGCHQLGCGGWPLSPPRGATSPVWGSCFTQQHGQGLAPPLPSPVSPARCQQEQEESLLPSMGTPGCGVQGCLRSSPLLHSLLAPLERPSPAGHILLLPGSGPELGTAPWQPRLGEWGHSSAHGSI